MDTLVGIKEQLANLQAQLLDGKDTVDSVLKAFGAINSQESGRPLNMKNATRVVPDEDKGPARAALSRKLATDRISAKVKPRAPVVNKTERGKPFQKEGGKGPEK